MPKTLVCLGHTILYDVNNRLTKSDLTPGTLLSGVCKITSRQQYCFEYQGKKVYTSLDSLGDPVEYYLAMLPRLEEALIYNQKQIEVYRTQIKNYKDYLRSKQIKYKIK